jgi:hypothetical protein
MPHPSPIPHLLLSTPVLSSLLTPHLSKHQLSAVHAKSEIPETKSVRNQTAASMSPYQCHRHSNMEKLAAMVAGCVLLGCSCSLVVQGGSQGEGEGRGAGGVPWHPWRRVSSSRTTPTQALVPCAAVALWPPETPRSTWCGNASLLFTECFDSLNDLLQWVFLDVKNSALGGKTTLGIRWRRNFLAAGPRKHPEGPVHTGHLSRSNQDAAAGHLYLCSCVTGTAGVRVFFF